MLLILDLKFDYLKYKSVKTKKLSTRKRLRFFENVCVKFLLYNFILGSKKY